MSPIIVTFTAPANIASLPPPQACVMFVPVDDLVLEGSHSLTLVISGTSLPTVAIVNPNTIDLTITDNEGIQIKFREFLYI